MKSSKKEFLLFIRSIFILLVFIILISIGLFPFYKRLCNEIKSDYNSAFVGGSQGRYGVSVDILKDEYIINSVNACITNGPSLRYKYFMIRSLIKNGKNLENIYLEISYNSLSTIDSRWASDYKMSGALFLRDYEIGREYLKNNYSLKNGDLIKLYTSYLQCSTMSMQESFFNVRNNITGLYGNLSFTRLHNFEIIDGKEIKRSDATYYLEKEESAYYFKEINKLCRDNNINLYYLVMPISDGLKNSIDNMNEFSAYLNEISEESMVLDFNLYKEDFLINDKESFYDNTHLNGKGKDNFTRILGKVINKIDNGEIINNLFYEEY